MIETSLEAMLQAPWGCYTKIGSSIIWCASRTLCGAYSWGRPSAGDTRAIVQLFDQYPHAMDPKFDMILDARAVEGVDGEALKILTGWMWTHRVTLLEHARISSVIRSSPIGFLFAGLLPAVVGGRSVRVTTSATEAFCAVLGDAGAAAAEEVEAIVLRLRGLSRELEALRSALAARLDTTLEGVARELGSSPRSLQRALATHGTTFHDEVISARMVVACELLLSTDLKVSAIASQLGISERAVTPLFRSRTGLTPIEWRTLNRPAR